MRDWHIMTFTGKQINLFNLRPEDIDIKDIAHSLSQANRFSGHTVYPISVAQHSVFVKSLCSGQPREVRLMALLHDASEAYLGDVTKWLKASDQMAGYRDLEDQITAAIFSKFGCSGNYRPVEVADKLMVRFEAEVGFPGLWKSFEGYPPVTSEERHEVQRDFIWEPWLPLRARSMFLREFHKVCN